MQTYKVFFKESSFLLSDDKSLLKNSPDVFVLMYQHGNVDIRVLKEILGHENLGTTEIYTHLSSEQMQKAAAASPLSQVKRRPAREKNE